MTVLFSTHILSDIERVCERAAILHHGRLIADGDLAELKHRHGVQQMDDLYLTLVEAAVMSDGPTSALSASRRPGVPPWPFFAQEYLRIMRSRLAQC